MVIKVLIHMLKYFFLLDVSFKNYYFNQKYYFKCIIIIIADWIYLIHILLNSNKCSRYKLMMYVRVLVYKFTSYYIVNLKENIYLTMIILSIIYWKYIWYALNIIIK